MTCTKSKSGNHVCYEFRDIQNDGTVIVKRLCSFCGLEIVKEYVDDYKQAAGGDNDISD
jgi:hypothetical protein